MTKNQGKFFEDRQIKRIREKFNPSLRKRLIRVYEYLKRSKRLLKRRLYRPPLPRLPEGKVWVNLGSGPTQSKEFINIDVVGWPTVHYVRDVTDLSLFGDETVDLLYASGLVEHLPPEKLISTLKEYRRVLKPGGIFRFSVPDFDSLIRIYQGNDNDVLVVRDQILGQKPPYDNHYTLWNRNFAERIMGEVGFKNPRLWTPGVPADKSSRHIKIKTGEDIYLNLNLEVEK